MLTNPNTLGLFEEKILEISDLAHSNGALMYCDGKYECTTGNNQAERPGV